MLPHVSSASMNLLQKNKRKGQQGRSDIVGPRAEMVGIAYIQHDAMRRSLLFGSQSVQYGFSLTLHVQQGRLYGWVSCTVAPLTIALLIITTFSFPRMDADQLVLATL